MNPYYKDYSEYLSEKFPGVKVQKLSVDAGFSCPNRDGTISRGGCIYCDNRSFTPRYCSAADAVAEQLRKGREFFSRKYPEMKYLAYFQSFTGTHAAAITTLRALYDEAAAQPDVVGLIIGTRPDALPADVLRLLDELNRRMPLFVEIGAETSHDRTLSLINRCHTWAQVEQAVEALSECGIDCSLHLIAGLPGEDDEMVIQTISRTLELRHRCPTLSGFKLHQLQIIRGTRLHQLYEQGEIDVRPYQLEHYLRLCRRIVEMVGKNMVIERFLSSAPPEMVVAPKWGLKNYEFVNLLLNNLSFASST